MCCHGNDRCFKDSSKMQHSTPFSPPNKRFPVILGKMNQFMKSNVPPLGKKWKVGIFELAHGLDQLVWLPNTAASRRWVLKHAFHKWSFVVVDKLVEQSQTQKSSSPPKRWPVKLTKKDVLRRVPVCSQDSAGYARLDPLQGESIDSTCTAVPHWTSILHHWSHICYIQTTCKLCREFVGHMDVSQ